MDSVGQRSPMTDDEYDAYRVDQIADGREFEDFATWALLFYRGIVTVPFRSKRWQFGVGESTAGVEFKLDKKLATTGNLAIEKEEKATLRSKAYVPSGIMRADNTWLYVIGNYKCIWVFSKVMLRGLDKRVEEGGARKYKEFETKTKTGRGYLLPKKDADFYAAAVIVIMQEDRPDQ